MFKKLIAGEYSLSTTFWKFGVLWMLCINFILKIIGGFVVRKLGAVSIYEYFVRHFKFTNFDTATLVSSLLYIGCLSGLVAYSVTIFLGVWRSSQEYDKSVWIRHLSRLAIVLIIFFTFKRLM